MFRIGDRVAAVKHPDQIGVIAAIDPGGWIGVKHNEYMGGHTLDGHCANGHGWWYMPDSLVLLEEDTSTFEESDVPLSFLFE